MIQLEDVRDLGDVRPAIRVGHLCGRLTSPEAVAEALSHEGYQECKREVIRSRRDHRPLGGLWQGLDGSTGSVASLIWVNGPGFRDAVVFVDVDRCGDTTEAGMETWWSELDDAVLRCLSEGALEPSEIGRRLGCSEEAVTSLVAMLAREGKVRIRCVAATAPDDLVVHPRSFWCASRRQPVTAEFREEPSDRRRVAVNWCSAFAPPTSIRCTRDCLGLDRLPLAAERALAP